MGKGKGQGMVVVICDGARGEGEQEGKTGGRFCALSLSPWAFHPTWLVPHQHITQREREKRDGDAMLSHFVVDYG